jgi:single-strand DNA-binding protein
MSATFNQFQALGRVGQDPKVAQVGETAVTRFSVATNETWKDKSGEKKERVDWHNVEAWGKLGELVAKYVKKGSNVFVVGKLRIDTKGEGDDRRTYVTVRADDVRFLDSKPQGDEAPAEAEETPLPF